MGRAARHCRLKRGLGDDGSRRERSVRRSDIVPTGNRPVRGGVCNETVRVAGSAVPARVGGAGPVARGAGPLAMNQVATAAASSNPASSNPASILENLKLSGAASPPKR
jgi:hypothetical protein